MLQGNQVEELVCLITGMDRLSIARHLREFRAGFPVDFTAEFIETTELERLRHIFLALCLQTHQMPEIEDEDEVSVVLEHVA
jgi:hypothetical protein